MRHPDKSTEKPAKMAKGLSLQGRLRFSWPAPAAPQRLPPFAGLRRTGPADALVAAGLQVRPRRRSGGLRLRGVPLEQQAL
jgi:hypothetical protein